MNPDRPAITRLLNESRGGNKAAFDELMPLVYDQLCKLASRRLAVERKGHTLRTTEIVHEAYLRLVDSTIDWNDRAHFYAISARVMRRILIDYARSRNRDKRGGCAERVSLDEAMELGAAPASNLLEVDAALERLARKDARKGTIVELLVFGGLTYEEAAHTLSISPATLHRELRLAKAFLQRELSGAAPRRAAAPPAGSAP